MRIDYNEELESLKIRTEYLSKIARSKKLKDEIVVLLDSVVVAKGVAIQIESDKEKIVNYYKDKYADLLIRCKKEE